ncbi:MAG: type II toxin-antitoxin system RelE/ParE family toxin, partial [Candidatus Eisenbacteria bacterium]
TRDLDSIDSYIRKDNAGAAVRTVLRVLDALEGLAEFPNVGRPGRLFGTRELVISRTPFIAVYRVRGNVVWILRVLHSSQKWSD